MRRKHFKRRRKARAINMIQCAIKAKHNQNVSVIYCFTESELRNKNIKINCSTGFLNVKKRVQETDCATNAKRNKLKTSRKKNQKLSARKSDRDKNFKQLNEIVSANLFLFHI